METNSITRAVQVPLTLQVAAKVALAVGAGVRVSADGEHVCASFKDSDNYYFDPENVTMHALEALNAARIYGFVVPHLRDLSEVGAPGGAVEVIGWLRQPLIIRTVFSAGDVRMQIGASRWYLDEHLNTATALRGAVVKAFAAYYDEAIAPYTEA